MSMHSHHHVSVLDFFTPTSDFRNSYDTKRMAFCGMTFKELAAQPR